ncbi:substrate-binding domain-containing protein [Aliidiomarina maris]|uniref:Phosphate transport system substrate-binding protein n=1 Tax=Aliidiomarina maris TaxID=531312 RepID=A0A327WUK6_9GAMM|nr:substrate-binding domain-containing protein [Aliidiomarina maris]MCL5049787.1 substrate-binding domain-containing protein [Bacillota bacterium]RAJ95356.1 phosphate transport system substrate-binding protein [Aliidiomarina maris]RUO22753.1 phosphonate ABC transporter substrate-binding protein [Aliidiomarina maris]
MKRLATILCATAALTAFGAQAQQRDVIQISGSSTVLPFSSIAAEEFGNNFSRFRTPVVGSGGSGGGLRQFCQGVGANTIDIANSSRAIRPNELANCHANGVNQVIEVKIGYDGIVFASRAGAGDFKLEPKHVFLAQARQVPQNGQMVANPYTNWSQIDSSLPDQDILLAIPGSNHGTREVYEEKVILDGCKAFSEITALDSSAQNDVCLAMRTDGRVVEIAGDYTETLARLEANRNAVGVFGLSFYESNRDRLQVATVSGVVPTIDNIISGEYPVSRPLYFYIKGEHIGVIPGLQEFAMFYLSDMTSGFGSILEEAGLIPLGDDERQEVIQAIRSKQAL